MWGYDEPEPQPWVIRGFVPEGHATILAADGGTGKSFLALYLGTCVALGRPFLGLETARCGVLYVDYELDAETAKRRHLATLRGVGLDQYAPDLAGWFSYYRPTKYLPDGALEIAAVARATGSALVVLDSLTVASSGDAMAQQDVTASMEALRACGTVFALDHVSGANAKAGASSGRPFGSVFKRNLARATFSLGKADGGGFVLKPDKNNFGPAQDLLCYVQDFDTNDFGDLRSVTFRRTDSTDEALIGGLGHLSTLDITAHAVRAIYDSNPTVFLGGGVQAEDVMAWRSEHEQSVNLKTVQNHLSALSSVRVGRIRKHPISGYLPMILDPVPDAPVTKGPGIGNDEYAPSRPVLDSLPGASGTESGMDDGNAPF